MLPHLLIIETSVPRVVLDADYGSSDTTIVHRYDESDPWQTDIDLDDEYYRAELEVGPRGRKVFKASRLRMCATGPQILVAQPSCRALIAQPIQGSSKTPGGAYVPLPLGTTPMVFCPRPSEYTPLPLFRLVQTLLRQLALACKQWHHRGPLEVLRKPTTKQLKDLAGSGLELLDLRSFPPDPARVSVPPIAAEASEPQGASSALPTPPPDNISPSRSSKKAKAGPSSAAEEGINATLPVTTSASQQSDMLDLIEQTARRSIARGEFSIVGNAKAVLEAREIVNARSDLAAGETVDQLVLDWQDTYALTEEKEELKEEEQEVGQEEAGRVERYLCPSCNGVI